MDSRHITGKHFEHSALVQDIMVFLKERAEKEGVIQGVRRAFKRCVGALCCLSVAGASQQQRKPGQDKLLTEDKSSSPPAARPVRKLQRGARNFLLRSLIVLSFVAASCAGIVPAVQTDLRASCAPSSRLPVCVNGPQSSFEEGSILAQDSLSGWVAAIAALVTAIVCSAGLGCIIRARPQMQPQGSSSCSWPCWHLDQRCMRCWHLVVDSQVPPARGSAGRKRGTASSVALTAATLAVLVGASQVGSVTWYQACSSDADCEYEGCNNNPCSTDYFTCGNGKWQATCCVSGQATTHIGANLGFRSDFSLMTL